MRERAGFALIICAGLVDMIFSPTFASYNANAKVIITNVWVYDGGVIGVAVSPMPTTGCPQNDFFMIPPPPETPDLVYKAWYSHALSSYAMKGNVNVGYDNAGGNCYPGWGRPKLHNFGTAQ